MLGEQDTQTNAKPSGGAAMRRDKLMLIGIAGTVIAAICCFTPLLVWLFAVAGLSAAIGVLDYVLLPMLGFFIAMTGYAVWKRMQAK